MVKSYLYKVINFCSEIDFVYYQTLSILWFWRFSIKPLTLKHKHLDRENKCWLQKEWQSGYKVNIGSFPLPWIKVTVYLPISFKNVHWVMQWHPYFLTYNFIELVKIVAQLLKPVPIFKTRQVNLILSILKKLKWIQNPCKKNPKKCIYLFIANFNL